jgi:hypothetical protein
MATSGSTDFNRTGTQIITFAHKKLNILASGATVGTNDLADGLEALEMMIKSWQTEGIRLWLETLGRVFVVPGQTSYNLPGANACNISELSETTLDADEAIGQTVLSVTSTTQGAGFTDADVIGIVTDSDTIQWTTIVSSVTDDTVTITDALTVAASSGNRVYVYTNAIERPLRVESARRLNNTIETPMIPLAKADYDYLTNKTNEGPSVQYYYDPQLSTGVLYLWPTPNTVADAINITYRRTVEDFDSGANDPDFPQEWLECLGFNLAVRIAGDFGKQVTPTMAAIAGELKENIEGWDAEEQSIYFGGSGWGHGSR